MHIYATNLGGYDPAYGVIYINESQLPSSSIDYDDAFEEEGEIIYDINQEDIVLEEIPFFEFPSKTPEAHA